MLHEKYGKHYYLPPEECNDWTKKDSVDKAPMWCSVDLRDGNQALIEPMSVEEKLEYFKLLVKIGFKEIEVGDPASSDSDYQFIRILLEQDLIPDDVTIQIITDIREQRIRKSFESIRGAKRAIVHLYHSCSVTHREQIYQTSREETAASILEGARLMKELGDTSETDCIFEFSPENFANTEMDYVLEVVNGVLDIWKPEAVRKAIINLPGTVQLAMPHAFAQMVEYMSRHMHFRGNVILSLHPHNDRGTAVADAELGLLAGADRIEGTLFGNGERTGNVDIVNLAMNLFSHGIDPELDLSNIPEIRSVYEHLTRMQVHERAPYSGDLVFTAFFRHYQDTIAKGMEWREQHPEDKWSVPYLPVDPKDVGRTYDSDVIRINSQSGKGGIAYVLRQEHGLSLPDAMKGEVGHLITGISDREHKELSPGFIYQVFEDKYINRDDVFTIHHPQFRQLEDGVLVELKISQGEEERGVTANGNGRLSAVSNAIKQYFDISFELTVYEEHALSRGSSSKAATYVGISKDGAKYWGVGIHEDIIVASIQALASAVNQIEELSQMSTSKDQRLLEILNYIQMNYLTVTLEELSEKFYLSKPYLSKYIKEKSGSTFGETLKRVRMKKARMLLKNRNMTVESIAESVGYQNVEHFNRLFKKAYGMTPIQFRNQKSDVCNR